jgi:phosphatidylserine/phosphatidylglycerophosphate/cardiolipin synthase-like enzyme
MAGKQPPGAFDASRVRVIVDAEDYFDLMQQAMLKARERIFLIGWDFDTRIHLTHGRRWWQKMWRREFPSRLGSFIVWLIRHRRNLQVRILTWSIGAVKFTTRGAMLFDVMRWAVHPRIDFKFDRVHPIGCSHHQKIAILDDALAVCGGIDIADRRWDTRDHREQDPRRKRPGGTPYGPWHDITMMMEGEVALALDELGRDRWARCGGDPLSLLEPSARSAWPDHLEPHFTNVEVGIARTRAELNEDPGVHEIESLFLQHIARARRFIYAENQYFASRAIAEAVSARLVEDDPPEIVIINPASADGWIESMAMDPARAQLVRALQEIDGKQRFHLYVPYTGETPVYVHAKVLIVDDEVLRIGSANFNNRSMRLDSECDIFIDCARPANGHCAAAIRALRHSLLAEHCGMPEDQIGELIERAGSMAGMIAALDEDRGRKLRPYVPGEPTDLEIQMAERQTLDPEDPAALFRIGAPPRGRGLFRPGSLLARSMDRIRNKRRRA